MEELLQALDNASNVRQINYCNIEKEWIIIYKTNLNPDHVATEDLIDFLNNA